MSKRLERQELENGRQTAIIDRMETALIRQGEVISRLEEALISMDRKCKPEVLENGKNKSFLRLQTTNTQIVLKSIHFKDIPV